MENLNYKNKIEDKERESFKEGDIVKVKRSNGQMEDGWRVLGVFSGMVTVEKVLTEEEAISERANKITLIEKKIADLLDNSVAHRDLLGDAAEAKRLQLELGAVKAAGPAKAIEKRISIDKLKAWQSGGVEKVQEIKIAKKEVIPSRLKIGDSVKIPMSLYDKSEKPDANWIIKEIQGDDAIVQKDLDGPTGEDTKAREITEMEGRIDSMLNGNQAIQQNGYDPYVEGAKLKSEFEAFKTKINNSKMLEKKIRLFLLESLNQ